MEVSDKENDCQQMKLLSGRWNQVNAGIRWLRSEHRERGKPDRGRGRESEGRGKGVRASEDKTVILLKYTQAVFYETCESGEKPEFKQHGMKSLLRDLRMRGMQAQAMATDLWWHMYHEGLLEEEAPKTLLRNCDAQM